MYPLWCIFPLWCNQTGTEENAEVRKHSPIRSTPRHQADPTTPPVYSKPTPCALAGAWWPGT